jgi:hypothetical protein
MAPEMTNPELPTRPPGAPRAAWNRMCSTVTQLAIVGGLVQYDTSMQLMADLCRTWYSLLPDEVGPYFQELDSALHAANADARQAFGPVALIILPGKSPLSLLSMSRHPQSAP